MEAHSEYVELDVWESNPTTFNTTPNTIVDFTPDSQEDHPSYQDGGEPLIAPDTAPRQVNLSHLAEFIRSTFQPSLPTKWRKAVIWGAWIVPGIIAACVAPNYFTAAIQSADDHVPEQANFLISSEGANLLLTFMFARQIVSQVAEAVMTSPDETRLIGLARMRVEKTFLAIGVGGGGTVGVTSAVPMAYIPKQIDNSWLEFGTSLVGNGTLHTYAFLLMGGHLFSLFFERGEHQAKKQQIQARLRYSYSLLSEDWFNYIKSGKQITAVNPERGARFQKFNDKYESLIQGNMDTSRVDENDFLLALAWDLFSYATVDELMPLAWWNKPIVNKLVDVIKHLVGLVGGWGSADSIVGYILYTWHQLAAKSIPALATFTYLVFDVGRIAGIELTESFWKLITGRFKKSLGMRLSPVYFWALLMLLVYISVVSFAVADGLNRDVSNPDDFDPHLPRTYDEAMGTTFKTWLLSSSVAVIAPIWNSVFVGFFAFSWNLVTVTFCTKTGTGLFNGSQMPKFTEITGKYVWPMLRARLSMLKDYVMRRPDPFQKMLWLKMCCESRLWRH